MNDFPTRVLILTVGGSHEPILTAVRELKPSFVCFVCSEDDPATGQKGSHTQVTGRGNCIKARKDDPAPTLSNIPTQLELPPERFDHLLVPSDDFDTAYRRIADKLLALRTSCPAASLKADFTGGTKTMTAALVSAVLETDDVELRFVTGARSDLEKVKNGTQSSTVANVEGIRLDMAMRPLLGAWSRYAYGEAAEGLARISLPSRPDLRPSLQRARDLSQAFDLWDRFDHAAAREMLGHYKNKLGPFISSHYVFLDMLAGAPDDARTEPARLLDLWLNAERRAAQRRFDDAVARGYRLIEWTAQWLLKARAGVNTSNLSAEDAARVQAPANRNGIYQAGLFAAWMLASEKIGGRCATFWTSERDRLLHYLKQRNDSILAHGYSPVSETDWVNFSAWMSEAFLPMLKGYAKEFGVRLDPPQLPVRAFWEKSL